MNELLAKDARATLEAFKQAGAVCGKADNATSRAEALPQAEVNPATSCPREHFCTLPGGAEVCIYNLSQLPRMTQITREEVAQAVTPPVSPEVKGVSEMEILAVLSVFIAGIALGRYWPKKRKDGDAPAGKSDMDSK